MVVIERGDLVMVFNFHPVQSYTDYRVGCNNPGGCKRGGGGQGVRRETGQDDTRHIL